MGSMCYGQYVLWTVCVMDSMCYGQYVLWTVCVMDSMCYAILIRHFSYSFNTIVIILYLIEMTLICINILPIIYDVYSTLYFYVLKTFSSLTMAVVQSRNM